MLEEPRKPVVLFVLPILSLQGPPSLPVPSSTSPTPTLQVPGRAVSCSHLELLTVLPCPFLSSCLCRSPGIKGLICGGMNSCKRQGMSLSLSGVMLRTHSSSYIPVVPQANPRQVCMCGCLYYVRVKSGFLGKHVTTGILFYNSEFQKCYVTFSKSN